MKETKETIETEIQKRLLDLSDQIMNARNHFVAGMDIRGEIRRINEGSRDLLVQIEKVTPQTKEQMMDLVEALDNAKDD